MFLFEGGVKIRAAHMESWSESEDQAGEQRDEQREYENSDVGCEIEDERHFHG